MKSKVTFVELKVAILSEPRAISAAKAAMTPEMDDSKRCKLSLHTDKTGRKLSLILSSKDLVSLRAGLNTNLRLAASALKGINAAKRAGIAERSQKDSINQN